MTETFTTQKRKIKVMPNANLVSSDFGIFSSNQLSNKYREIKNGTNPKKNK